MMFRKSLWVPRLFFATQQQSTQSIQGKLINNSGHKPPAIADTPAGRYAGSLFTAASKKEALQTVLTDLTHLGKVIQSEP